MKASDDLNTFSSDLLEREITAEDAKKMKQLQSISKKECKHYQKMAGDEMRRRQKMCK